MSKKNILSLIFSFGIFIMGYSQIIFDDSTSSHQRKVIDQIVAQIGDNPIYLSEIEAQKSQLKNQLENEGELENSSDCEIMEELLYQKLLLNQAKLDSIDISDEQVNAEMENRLRTIEYQIGSREKLEKFYGKTYTQIKNEFFDDIKDRLLSKEMERQITRENEVSPKDVKKYFKSLKKDDIPLINEQITIQQIVVYPKITQENKNEVIEKLKKWKKEVEEEGRSFAAIATVHSEDYGSAKNGGKLEATRGMMVRPFEAAAYTLSPGEVSDVIETEYGFHILQLVSRTGDNYVVRHILLSPETSSKELSAAANLIDECYNRLTKHEIDWKTAVREYSEDESTKQNNGTLSNPYTGEQSWDVSYINEIDPQIYSITNGLDVGEISEPALYTDQMARKEGVRIVRIHHRTEPHQANLKDDYNFLKEEARREVERKTIENWINRNTHSSYIRISERFDTCSFKYNWK